ncbi:MAG: crossover junction endodeoxyribonuclease RuvC [Patiriisocius sp.]|jgi:crossover junction endodeoxyribonuclease RuvC
MKVLGVDPGYDRLGVAVIAKENGKEVLEYSSCVETDKKDHLTDRLFVVGAEFQKLLDTYSPDAVGIETLFFNKNVKTAIGVAQARGIIIYLAKKAGCQVFEYGPQEIKIAVTGYGKSDKNAVIDMVKRLVLNVPKTALDDEYDAIAVGITTLAHIPNSAQ